MLHRLILAGWTVLGFAVVSPPAWAQDGALFVSLPGLAQADPEAALSEIETLLTEQQALSEPDQRLVFDLYRLTADLLIDLGREEEAAQVLMQLANFAETNRGRLDVDPGPLLDEAAGLFERSGDLDFAREALARLNDLYRDGARSGEAIASVLKRRAQLADLSGDPEGAADLREAATAMLSGGAVAVDQPTRGDAEGFRAVDVYYATDRARTGSTSPADFYGFDRGDLELGVATVTIPEQHVPGMVEAPSIWKLEFRADPVRHIVLQSIEPVDPDTFFGRLQSEFRQTPEREAFVFVHGYNVRFAQAARRAAQIAYDMNYVGVPILYSWPSRGSTIGYVADTAVVRLSGRRLSRFLDDLVTRSGAETIHIVAHSMGNRALTDALELLALRRGVQPGDAPLFGQILFAAPDVDAGLFREMLPTIRPIAERLTLYASKADWALEASRRLHGDTPRAGIGGDGMLTDAHIDSIDMSELGEDMLSHNYFADDSSALADMTTLFWQNTAPQFRCGLASAGSGDDQATAWYYRSGACADRSLVGLLGHLRRANVQSPEQAREMVRATIVDAELATQLADVVARIVAE